jgi:hypothetical protein
MRSSTTRSPLDWHPEHATLALMISLVTCAATVAGAVSGVGPNGLVAVLACAALLSVAWWGIAVRRQLRGQRDQICTIVARLDGIDDLLWPPCVAHLRQAALDQGFRLSRTATDVVFVHEASGEAVRAPIEPLAQPVIARMAQQQLLAALRDAGFREPWRRSPLLTSATSRSPDAG